jgi:hypothetical protein
MIDDSAKRLLLRESLRRRSSADRIIALIKSRLLVAQQPQRTIAVPGNRATVLQRECHFEDFEGVKKLQARCNVWTDTLEHWHHRFGHNSSITMGWVLEADGNIVGFQGNMPLVYCYGDRRVLIATGTGLVVEPTFRAHTIKLMTTLFRQKDVDLVLLTVPIESVGKIAMLLRAFPLPQSDAYSVLFWVIDAREFSHALARKYDFAEGIGRLTAILLRAERTVRWRGPRAVRHKLNINQITVDQIDQRFDGLWQRKLAEKPRLLADRSAASLRWHLTVPHSPRKSLVLCCHSMGRLVGYAVIQYCVNAFGLQRSELVDLIAERDDPEIIENLLVAAYRTAENTGSHIFQVLGFPRAIRNILHRWRPYRDNPACPFFYKVTDHTSDLNTILGESNEEVWYATPFDGDTIFFE